MILSKANLAVLVAATCLSAKASAMPLGSDADACVSGRGPAVQATIIGLKDRSGRLNLELYPANEADFLKDDGDLVREGKVFRRVQLATPASGAVVMCIKVPSPGRYALLFTHDRDGRNQFNIWRDGAGFPSNVNLGRSRPKVSQATVDVGSSVVIMTIQAQYLRGLSGFGPAHR